MINPNIWKRDILASVTIKVVDWGRVPRLLKVDVFTEN